MSDSHSVEVMFVYLALNRVRLELRWDGQEFECSHTDPRWAGEGGGDQVSSVRFLPRVSVSAHLDTVLRLTGPAAGALGTTSKPRHAAINNNKTIPSPENIGPAEYLVRKYNR